MTLASMLLLISLSTTAALRPAPHVRMSAPAISVAAALRPAPHVRMAAPEAVAAATTPLTADRYVATNRFRVRSGKANRLEERWRNRKSRLSFLPGFRYFHLMRRVGAEGEEAPADEYDYVSLTIWQEKENFEAWRKCALAPRPTHPHFYHREHMR